MFQEYELKYLEISQTSSFYSQRAFSQMTWLLFSQESVGLEDLHMLF